MLLSCIVLFLLFHSTVKIKANDDFDGKKVIKLDFFGNEQNDSFIEIELGTPPQPLNVTLDFDSDLTWVISDLNPYCFDIDFQFYRSYYNNYSYSYDDILYFCYDKQGTFKDADSSTFDFFSYDENPIFSVNTSFKLDSEDRTVATGLWGKDVLWLNNNWNFSTFPFGLALSANKQLGTFGISSFTNNTNSNNQDLNFLDLLLENKFIERKIVSEYFRFNNNEFFDYKGVALIGGIDHTKIDGNLTVLPIINRYDYNINPYIKHADVTLSSFSIKISNSVITNSNFSAEEADSIFDIAVGLLTLNNLNHTLTENENDESMLEIQFTDKKYPIALFHEGINYYFPPSIFDDIVQGFQNLDVSFNESISNYTDIYFILKNLNCHFSYNLSGYIIDVPINNLATNMTYFNYYTDFDNNHHNKSKGDLAISFSFRKSNIGDIFLLGKMIFTNYYAVYDFEAGEIGISKLLNSNSTDEEITGDINFDNVDMISKYQSLPNTIQAPHYSDSYFVYVTSYISTARYDSTKVETFTNYTSWTTTNSGRYLISSIVGSYDSFVTTSSGTGPWSETVTTTITGGTEEVTSFKSYLRKNGFTATFPNTSATFQSGIENLNSANNIQVYNFSNLVLLLLSVFIYLLFI
ncbi:acid protease [Ascoidea rubescens DSM 1968]|uniref:Acid protease n=1 Tax=Ascoidea rubescens DSM 1968 TaxID=1344418 RepID=A0A1D2VJ56_9ASCO|nr:acid protease [Ascoidea rubescens DSM 1968]ODV61666.1 acid protease [Ascoidea rubescens DSM 1968]